MNRVSEQTMPTPEREEEEAGLGLVLRTNGVRLQIFLLNTLSTKHFIFLLHSVCDFSVFLWTFFQNELPFSTREDAIVMSASMDEDKNKYWSEPLVQNVFEFSKCLRSESSNEHVYAKLFSFFMFG